MITMKKLSMILALVLALALVMTGCGTKKDDTAADAPAVSEDAAATENTEGAAEGGTLVMATNAEFPPYEYHEGDEIVGIDAEIAAAIAEKLGMELQIEDMAFDSLIPAIQSNKADMVLAGMTVTEDRLENVNFSDSYATGVQVVIVKEDSDIKSVDDLFADGANHSIGVQTATAPATSKTRASARLSATTRARTPSRRCLPAKSTVSSSTASLPRSSSRRTKV